MPRTAYAVLVCLILPLLAGCAGAPAPALPTPTAPTSTGTVADPERADVATARALSGRIGLPTEADMAPDVELVTFSYRSGTDTRRDTVRGAPDVARWLMAFHSAQLPQNEFILAATETLICDRHVVQRGRYRVKSGVRRHPIVHQRFMARWTPGREGMQIDRLWLAPEGHGRPAAAARRCVPITAIGARLRRFSIAFESVLAEDIVAPIARERMFAAGLELTERWPIADPARFQRFAFTARAGYRFDHRWSLSGLMTRYRSETHEGFHDYHSTQRLVAHQTLYGLLGRGALGPVAVGLGPAFQATDFQWNSRPHSWKFEPEPPLSESRGSFGLLTELGIDLPSRHWLGGRATLRYTVLPTVVAPGYRSVEPFEVPLSRPAATFGVAVRF